MIERLCEIIRREERHPDYKRTVELAELYKALITGLHMDNLMIRFGKRETDVEFEQRKKITQHITKTVTMNLMKPFQKVPRSNSIQKTVEYEDNDVKKLTIFREKLDTFWGNNSLDTYMNKHWLRKNFIDPNAFLIIEWKPFDNTKTKASPYPFEISAEQAIFFETFNDRLTYLVALTTKSVWETIGNKEDTKDYKVFTMYGETQTVQFEETNEDNLRKAGIDLTKIKDGLNGGQQQYDGIYKTPKKSNEYFLVTAFTPHNLGFVPALCIGYREDDETDGRTYISPFEEAVPILMKLVKCNSELDLTMALHAFPQKIQYSQACKFQGCKQGFMPDGVPCGHCHGTGLETITSSQEMISIAMPKNPEDIIQLDNIIHYEYPPVDLVKFQDAYVKSLTEWCKEAVFNSELFSNKQVAETATGKNIDLQHIYDSLYDFAVSLGKTWEFIVKTVSMVTEMNEGLIYYYIFNKDFKMKSLTDLYMDLKFIGDARGDEIVKQAVQDDIMRVVYSDNQREMQKYLVRKSFFPFNGKTSEQILKIIEGSNLVTPFTRVFWANFGFVFDEIELEQVKDGGGDFFYMPRDKQWELIQAKVNEILDEMESTTDDIKTQTYPVTTVTTPPIVPKTTTTTATTPIS